MIDVAVIDEKGVLKLPGRGDPDLFLDLVYRTRSKDSSKQRLLDDINPYGDTIFNTLQARRILLELDDLCTTVENEAELRVIASIRVLFEQCVREAHQYVKFVGD